MEPTRNHETRGEQVQRISFGLEDFQRYFGGLPVLAKERNYEAETRAREAGLIVIFSSSSLAGLLPESTPELGDLIAKDSSAVPTGPVYEQQNQQDDPKPQTVYSQRELSAPQSFPSMEMPMVGPVHRPYARGPQIEQYLLARQNYEMSSSGQGLEGRLNSPFMGSGEMTPWHYYHSSAQRYH